MKQSYNSSTEEQPFYVLQDDSYDRMLHKLQNGSDSEWSYTGLCPHRNKNDSECTKFMNVLHDNKIVRIVNGEQRPVIKASDMPQYIGECVNRVTSISIHPDMFLKRDDYADYLKTTVINNGCVTLPINVSIEWKELDEPTRLNVDSIEDYTTLVDTLCGKMESLCDDLPFDADSSISPCMDVWKELADKLHEFVKPEAVVSIDRNDNDIGRHMKSFMNVMKKHKKMKRHGNILLTNGGGQFEHTFPGKTDKECVEVIGVPKYDCIFYIAEDGRTDCVGAKASELLQLIGMDDGA